jgi:hypothetical protein
VSDETLLSAGLCLPAHVSARRTVALGHPVEVLSRGQDWAWAMLLARRCNWRVAAVEMVQDSVLAGGGVQVSCMM